MNEQCEQNQTGALGRFSVCSELCDIALHFIGDMG